MRCLSGYAQARQGRCLLKSQSVRRNRIPQTHTVSWIVFNGHIHAYEHIERRGRDYIRVATTGGVWFPERRPAIDHFLLVTVDNQGADIANLKMSGVLDKTGHIPLEGDDVCFELAACPEDQ